MKPAQISLTKYSVNELQFKLNKAFDQQRPTSVHIDDLRLQPELSAIEPDRRTWEILLRLSFDPPAERNIAYSCLIEVVGTIVVDPSLKDQDIERFVRIQGTSLVFSATREIVRAVTSRGLWGGILLPTVNFWEPKPAVVEQQPDSQPEASAPMVAEGPK